MTVFVGTAPDQIPVNGMLGDMAFQNKAAVTISTLTSRGTTLTDAPTLGTELLTGGLWTSTGWTGNNTTGWVNEAGNTTALSSSVAAFIGTTYQIVYTVTRTAGSVTIAFGGQSQAGIVNTGTFGPTATSGGTLVITPTNDFIGSVIISIKAITAVSTAVVTGVDSNGVVRYEERVSSALNNVFLGLSAGAYNTTGAYNSAIGVYALYGNTTGTNNVAVGQSALQINTTGNSNSAIGVYALYSNKTGNYNTASGAYALQINTTGNSNTASGAYALWSNTTGAYNTASGVDALFNNTTGNNNTASGLNALYSNTTGNYNTCLGASSGSAVTIGSNNVILGSYTGSSSPISAIGSNYVVLSGGDGNIRTYYDSSGNQVTYGVLATSAAAPTIASATTIAPTKAITFISGVTPIVTITPPSPISLGGGQITLIPTGVFTTTTAGNIALASTSVVSKALIMTYDATTTKWYPSY